MPLHFHGLAGEAVRVTLEITNRSGRSVRPKFTLYEKQSFFAQGRRRVHTHDILKEKAEAVESSKKETVTQVIHLPVELPSSILNCSIIKLEYRLKVKSILLCLRNTAVVAFPAFGGLPPSRLHLFHISHPEMKRV